MEAFPFLLEPLRAEMVDRYNIQLQMYYFMSWVYYANTFLVSGSNIELQAGRFVKRFFLGDLQVSILMHCEQPSFPICCNVKCIFLFNLSCVIYPVRILVNDHNLLFQFFTQEKGNDH